MDKKYLLAVLIVGGLLLFFFMPGKYDGLAKCMTEKGVKVYGAYWCPNCQKQEELFGKSYDYINYVECAVEGSGEQNELCRKAGIEAYPTWELPNGQRIIGVRTPEELAEITDCPLS